jgi:hypothetical protein
VSTTVPQPPHREWLWLCLLAAILIGFTAGLVSLTPWGAS